MGEYLTKSLETNDDRRVKLVFCLAEELHQRGYNFFNFDGSPRETPDLEDNSFEFARSIRRLPNSGFLWMDKNYSVQIAGEFNLKDPYQVKVEVKGRNEFGVIERMLAQFNENYSLKPETGFEVKLKSPDYEIWTTSNYREIIEPCKEMGIKPKLK